MKKVLIVFCSIMILFLNTSMVAAHPIEMKISQGILQSFIDAAFPMTVRHDVNLLGAVQVPIQIRLHDPGPVHLTKPSGTNSSFLSLDMKYDVFSDSGLVAPSKGTAGGNFTVLLSHDQESLILSFGEMYLQVTPFLKISLASVLKPIRVPLFKGFPVKVQDKEIVGRFKDIAIAVEGTDLIIKGDFFFDKDPKEKTS